MLKHVPSAINTLNRTALDIKLVVAETLAPVPSKSADPAAGVKEGRQSTIPLIVTEVLIRDSAIAKVLSNQNVLRTD